MGEAENMEQVWRFYGAGPSDDDSARVEFFAPEAVWHVPGDNPVSGNYYGPEEIRTEIGARMQPLDTWTVEPKHVMANGDTVVAIVHINGSRGEHSVRGHGAHVFRFDDQGRIVEAWGFNEDQQGVDEMLRAGRSDA